ncbi:hypothetical protein [Microbulbifer guangxiensis]|uniref:hypothetical protein n=1 Tax=Microbulbifer guangxiensis TaxID=2904249 RepID=UPI001F20F8FA|nr:hypothetical protein [Microbulbifer guangxiensis]
MATYIWDENQQRLKVKPGSYCYRSKWACFSCRKSFTRMREGNKPGIVHCPDCKMAATDMGHLFEPPPKRSVRRWQIMELLGKYSLGFYTAGNVAFINYMIAGNFKLPPKEVEKNIIQYLSKNRGFKPSGT